MEIESSDGSRTLLKVGSVIEFGRGSGFKIDDRTVSRRHVSLRVNPLDESSSRAEFKVIGKNPIWVHSCKSRQVRTFRASEGGEMEIGDMFCVSAKNPIWFTLKKAEFEAETENNVKSELDFKSQLDESLENRYQIKDVVGPLELEPESIDISDIDPVKEFGFLVIGKEFDSYPKKMIRDIKNWNWFIEDPRVDNEDDDDLEENKRKNAGRRKRKNRREESEDEEWTGESEEEKEQLTNTRKVQRPTKYLTRSKDSHEPSNDMAKNGHRLQKKNTLSSTKRVDKEEEEEEEEEDDETLGGFIVDDNVEEEEKEIDEEEEEEDEEFDD